MMFSIKGYVHYIFVSLFFSLKESFSETRINVFYFASKAFFVLEKKRLYDFRYSNFMTPSNV